MSATLGGFLGWTLIAFYAATLLNYLLKAINRKFGKSISTKPGAKKLMGLLMKIFVKNHRLFGFGTIILLLSHFAVQFSRMGVNLTGALAASLLLLQVGLGIYGSTGNRKRGGVWFVLHRTVAVLIVVAVVVHLLMPYLGKNTTAVDTAGSQQTAQEAQEEAAEEQTEAAEEITEANAEATEEAAEVDEKDVFTLEELAAYNGENGQPAYVAYEGKVYDVTNVAAWQNGKHNGQTAGMDLTDQLSKSPHGDKVFKDLPEVGKLED